jgi:prepilin peptidase CpaA
LAHHNLVSPVRRAALEKEGFAMTPMTIATLLVFPAFMAYAAVSDMLTMTISNRLCMGLAASFLAFAVLCGLDLAAFGWHLAAGFMVLAIGFGFFAAGWIGGGDAKLAAVTALWFGFDPLLVYLIFAGMLGGMLTLGLLQARTYPLPAFASRWPWALRLHAPETGIPYGIALAASALIVFPQTALWRSAIGM